MLFRQNLNLPLKTIYFLYFSFQEVIYKFLFNLNQSSKDSLKERAGTNYILEKKMRLLFYYFKLAKANYVSYFKEKPLDGFYFLFLLILPFCGNIFYNFFFILYEQIFEFSNLDIITRTIVIWFVITILILFSIARKFHFNFGQIIGKSFSFFIIGVICHNITSPYISFFEVKERYFIFHNELPEPTEENNDYFFDKFDFDDYDFSEANLVFSTEDKNCEEIEKRLKLNGKIFDLKKLLFWQTGYLYGGRYQKFEDKIEFDLVSKFFLFGPVIIVEILINSLLKYSFSLFFLSIILMLLKKAHLLKIDINKSRFAQP